MSGNYEPSVAAALKDAAEVLEAYESGHRACRGLCQGTVFHGAAARAWRALGFELRAVACENAASRVPPSLRASVRKIASCNESAVAPLAVSAARDGESVLVIASSWRNARWIWEKIRHSSGVRGACIDLTISFVGGGRIQVVSCDRQEDQLRGLLPDVVLEVMP